MILHTFVHVKKVFTWCLALCMLLGSVLPNGDLHELTKVPALIEHYLHHAQTEGLTLADFITQHYQNKEAQHQEEHQHLPFFQHNCGSHVYTLHEYVIQIPALPVHTQKAEVQHLCTYSFSLSRSIFQPPRA